MITLPPVFGMASPNEATNQPIAGSSAPGRARIAQPARAQVAKMATAKPIAASGTGPAMARLYWNEPITPSARPSRKSSA